MEAMSKLKRGKAGGRTGILPELLLCGCTELQDRFLLLMEDIWKGGEVVGDWKDAVIVPFLRRETSQGVTIEEGLACLTWLEGLCESPTR